MENENGFFVIIPHGEYCLLREAHSTSIAGVINIIQ
jgi:hypothetical protein